MNESRLLRRIEKAQAAADDVATRLHNLAADDLQLRLANWKTYRVELMRDFVLYTHLAIEGLLRELLVYRLKEEPRVTTVKQITTAINDLRSRDLVEWCGRLGILSRSQHAHLVELNRIRNKCGHTWIVDQPEIKRDHKGKRVRMIVVKFKGRDLFAGENFFADFGPIYSRLYRHLLGRLWKLQGLI
ncbi:MAG: hypothetical protein ACYCOU_14950 [Sulfobacillus sp.]